MNFCIASQFALTTAASPNCRHSVYGTITPASDQPIMYPRSPVIGAMMLKVPAYLLLPPTWESRMSVIHFERNPYTSAAYTAAPANACVSPDHPQRSLRCGQSVGTER